jgi:hypothetical protein
MYIRWINPRLLDKLVFELSNRGIYVGRHSYSFRLFFKGRIIAGIHVYPGYNEVVLRIYMSNLEYALEALDNIVDAIKKTLPGYKLIIQYIKPLI